MKKKSHLSPENVAYIHSDVWVCIFQMTLAQSNSYSKRSFFHISLPIHFFLLLIEHIVCGRVCVCNSTCMWAHIHMCYT